VIFSFQQYLCCIVVYSKYKTEHRTSKNSHKTSSLMPSSYKVKTQIIAGSISPHIGIFMFFHASLFVT